MDPINKYSAGRSRGRGRRYADEQTGSHPPELRKLVNHDRLYRLLEELSTGNAQSPGPDGVRPRDLSRAERGEHARYLEDLVRCGEYQPGTTRQVEIGDRVIRVGNVLDRAIGTRIAVGLGRWADPFMNEKSYAWRPERDGIMLLARLANLVNEGLTCYLGDDIRKMFDCVDIERAAATVQQQFGSRRLLARLLANQLRGHPSERRARGVRQGCGLSPLVMNLLCDELLEPLSSEYADISVVRYGDDFAIVGESSDSIVAARDRTGELVAEAGFELKREQSEPIDLARLNGPRPLLLGHSLAVESGRLVLGIPREAWIKLAKRLIEASTSEDPASCREAVAAGWAGAYAAAVVDSSAFLRKIRRTARRVGVRELDLRATEKALSAGQARWQRLIEQDREPMVEGSQS